MQLLKRHGDLAIYKLESLPKEGKAFKHSGKAILAKREATGHNHVITVEDEEAMILKLKENGDWLVQLTAPAKITHEEHKPITLVPGVYYIGKEREKDWFANSVRRVID